MQILILHPGALGDILLSLPAISLLRAKFPAARLTIACNVDHIAPLLGTYVDRAVSLSSLPLHNLYSVDSLPQADVDFWRSFDRIISWTGSGNADFTGKLKRICPGAVVASWRPSPREPRHVSQLFLDSLGPEIVTGTTPIPAYIPLRKEISSQGLRWLADHKWNGDPLVTIHPGAGSKGKRWPLSRFVELVRLMALHERNLLLIEGPAEPGLASRVAQEAQDAEPIIAKSLPLDLLSAVIANSSLFVGNDSGISHLAGALGARSIVLFGPTLPQHWAPLGPNITVLRNPQGCRGCVSLGDHHTCLENIGVEEVIRATNRS